MKTQILCAIAAVGLAMAGCAKWRENMGASKENDQNVLTGGPVTGTKLIDLPQPVRDTLKQQVPSAEVADIDKQSKGGQTVYKFSFTDSSKNPTLYISADGKIVKDMPSQSAPK